jgi:hypothetical protein
MAAIQDFLLAATILEAMQMHLDTRFRKGFHAVEHINDPTIIGRIRYVESNDV